MSEKTRFLTVVISITFLATASSCSKREQGETGTAELAAPTALAAPPTSRVPAGAELLPGENSVRASLAKRDYEAAVNGLLALRGDATGEKYTAYLTLQMEVDDALKAESTSDPGAAAARRNLEAVTRKR
jgi:hypothetical protein